MRRLCAESFLLLIFFMATATLCYPAELFSDNADRKQNESAVKDISVKNGDGRLEISWSINNDKNTWEHIKGFRLYQQRAGTEMGYNIAHYKLIKDLKLDTSYTVKNIKNGEQYVFMLKAYDRDDKEFWETFLFGFPGTEPEGKPEIPKNFYGSSGDGRAALYWDKNTERDIIGYELYRKGKGDEDFRLVARIPKIFRVTKKDEAEKFFQAITPTVYIDAKVENRETYEYKIRTVDREGYFSEFTDAISLSPAPYSPPAPDEILLLVNANSADSNNNGINDSEEVARHYAEKRGVPDENIIAFHLNRDKYRINYQRDIQKPLKEYLLKKNIAGKIKYIVPCYGMPIDGAGRALDSKLSDLFDRFTLGRVMGSPNPYFDSKKHFDGAYGIYLVTRIDGPTVEIAKSLVDKAMYAEKNVASNSGTAYFGNAGQRNSIGDKAISDAVETARERGIKVVYKNGGAFAEHELGSDAYWYYAWYHHYRDPIDGEWPAGAVGAHLISYSFSGIREDNPKWKSWVQGLLEKGITATFGSVIEPYLQAFTRADIFFEHFWSGEFNFAESFYMATPTVQWAMSAVGDPLFRLKKQP